MTVAFLACLFFQSRSRATTHHHHHTTEDIPTFAVNKLFARLHVLEQPFRNRSRNASDVPRHRNKRRTCFSPSVEPRDAEKRMGKVKCPNDDGNGGLGKTCVSVFDPTANFENCSACIASASSLPLTCCRT